MEEEGSADEEDGVIMGVVEPSTLKYMIESDSPAIFSLQPSKSFVSNQSINGNRARMERCWRIESVHLQSTQAGGGGGGGVMYRSDTTTTTSTGTTAVTNDPSFSSYDYYYSQQGFVDGDNYKQQQIKDNITSNAFLLPPQQDHHLCTALSSFKYAAALKQSHLFKCTELKEIKGVANGDEDQRRRQDEEELNNEGEERGESEDHHEEFKGKTRGCELSLSLSLSLTHQQNHYPSSQTSNYGLNSTSETSTEAISSFSISSSSSKPTLNLDLSISLCGA